ncbi:MAG: CHASE2 domain-containing protein [Coleofasciculus sp. G1-WW12-02]|uniref:CHASE2 domain-containing protein n=1 Tax=Coleofasciculus sp. G1-WW12-02 TaxID=3068483 RepID=UPI0032F7CA28
MRRNLWQKIKKEIAIWRGGALPGIVVTGLVILARLNGSLQSLEWITLDTFLRLRPPEPIDERVVLVGINEADIRDVGTYPIPDQEIARLLRTLQTDKPRAIGLDIVRDIPVNPGHDELVSVFKEFKTIIGIEKVLPVQIAPLQIDPPPELPPEQVGFSDTILDKDGNIRRSLLVTPTSPGYQFSLSLRLAETYLIAEGISLENDIHDPHAIRFGSTELPRFLPNSGGYVGIDAGGVQVLLNFRSGRERFRTLSLNDIKTGNFNPSWIRDRIVIIGITAPSVKDIVNTSAITNLNPPGQIYGVEFHAHSTSQILSAVLDGRSLLRTWSDGWEYLWIFGWGFVAISLGRLTQSPLKSLFGFGIVSLGIVGIGYVFIAWGWWIPVAPVLLILTLNGLGLSAFAFYQHDQALRSEVYVRQCTIEHTFNVIHNGPLQTLANVLRDIRDQDSPQNPFLSELENLNQEIRGVGEYLQREALTQAESLLLGSGFKLDLKLPIHELFYKVYRETLKRDNFPNFKTLKVKVRTFAPIESKSLSLEQKRELCQFLEEALCNVGKHAKGVTRLSAIGKPNQGWYTLSIKDNGCGICSSSENRGTKQCKNLAKQLGGTFNREPVSPRGTLCELTWPLVSRHWNLGKIGDSVKSFFLRKIK